MRRSLVLSVFLAVAASVLGACQPQSNEPVAKPPATPAPVATASPAVSPSASPGPKVLPDNSKKEAGKDKIDAKPTATDVPKPNK